ncbi:MAG: glycosyltransferase family protein [candidate division KSB1 bacterium]|nr:glycosyltransferase family protein [candidate division KSB1 bacterium]MDZ7274902.1 glycosyltransferase family protein [candidate division KSB1 bacterium]MDZ7286646.1 glycosyltransferase family protein [candidate division KSB1 bacterium]MDZ7299191.1 glycosyltransferase family protein [candidate division KSB1 bacterium]MDZ7308501.1 glycosyltransferase family protein [candidate division KSB1 bacterium]
MSMLSDKTAWSAAVILQARMGSTRLPGKVLRPVAGRPLLQWCLLRLAESRLCRRVIVATTTLPQDDAIAAFCEQQQVPCFRGSENDVLHRYHEAARQFCVDPVIRVTADCPLIDARVLDAMLEAYFARPVDYLSNTLKRSFPRGYDLEIFSFAALHRAQQQAQQAHEREHVTPFLYQHPQMFKLAGFENDCEASALRVTVDTPEDLQVVEGIYQYFLQTGRGHHFTLAELLQLWRSRPELAARNQHVRQKQLGE